ncbi:hypothetical protein Tco_0764245 [Tanacetum coccineum]
MEKNGKWLYMYAVGSQEYQVVCTRPDIASAGVDMLDGFDRGLQTHVQVFVDFDYAMGRSINVMGSSIKGYRSLHTLFTSLVKKRYGSEFAIEGRHVLVRLDNSFVLTGFSVVVVVSWEIDVHDSQAP